MAIPKAKKRKKPIQRRIKGQIQEPVFENIEKMTGAEFHRKRMYAQEFYRMEKDKTDYKKYIYEKIYAHTTYTSARNGEKVTACSSSPNHSCSKTQNL